MRGTRVAPDRRGPIRSRLALRKAPPQPALLVLGDMSIQGNIKPVRSLTELLQVAMDNGGKRALIPIENKRQFLEVNPHVLEQVDPVFFGDRFRGDPHRYRLGGSRARCACTILISP